jgi:hypothetical protein
MRHILAMVVTLAATPAWGQTNIAIPPPEYDHPYKGKITIQRFSDQKVLRAQCSPSPFPYLLGCAREAMGVCYIAMADDELLDKLNFPAEIVLRHERAHCNLWPNHHPGGRPIAPKSP